MKIAIIGVGTAGITTLSYFLYNAPPNFKIYSIHDPSKPILGVGESSTTIFTKNFCNGTKFNILEDGYGQQLDATLKLGVKYIDWRSHDFYSNLLPGAYGITFDNRKLKQFAFDRFEKIWGDKFRIIEGKCDIVENSDQVTLNINHGLHNFDYVIDCRGFPDSYDDYQLVDMPTNSAIVANITGNPDFQWTGHTATRNGWMFTLNVHSRISRGYLYNDKLTTINEALDDFERNYLLTRDATYNHFDFKSYHAKSFIKNRVIVNGNKALFYEPIEALSGAFYDTVSEYALSHMLGHIGTQPMNNQLLDLAHDYISVISYLYQGGSIYNTPFWRYAKLISKKHLGSSERWKKQYKFLKSLSREQIDHDEIVCMFGSKVWSSWDKHFGYKQMITGNDSLEW